MGAACAKAIWQEAAEHIEGNLNVEGEHLQDEEFKEIGIKNFFFFLKIFSLFIENAEVQRDGKRSSFDWFIPQ